MDLLPTQVYVHRVKHLIEREKHRQKERFDKSGHVHGETENVLNFLSYLTMHMQVALASQLAAGARFVQPSTTLALSFCALQLQLERVCVSLTSLLLLLLLLMPLTCQQVPVLLFHRLGADVPANTQRGKILTSYGTHTPTFIPRLLLNTFELLKQFLLIWELLLICFYYCSNRAKLLCQNVAKNHNRSIKLNNVLLFRWLIKVSKEKIIPCVWNELNHGCLLWLQTQYLHRKQTGQKWGLNQC